MEIGQVKGREGKTIPKLFIERAESSGRRKNDADAACKAKGFLF